MNKRRSEESIASRPTYLVSQNLLNGRPLPQGAILSDPQELKHINTYGSLPEYYIDYPFTCIDCGSSEIWTAEQQKWWYEVAKKHIDSFAVRCRQCRHKRKKSVRSGSRSKNEPDQAL
ncbi:MAG: zinc-ribbon domain-containing protein [Nitrospirae bacterium]|nr:zinc-ribbon domain-containing protein [Nitrospirota bacterium]